MVVTGRAHRAAVELQIPELTDANLVLETEPRDSSAAIGLAAAILERREPGVVIGSFAADHVIRGTRFFEMSITALKLFTNLYCDCCELISQTACANLD